MYLFEDPEKSRGAAPASRYIRSCVLKTTLFQTQSHPKRPWFHSGLF